MRGKTRRVSRADLARAAQAIVDAHVEAMRVKFRPRSVRLDPARRELVYSLCLRTSLEPDQVVARALDEYAVRQGMGAQVERARVRRATP